MSTGERYLYPCKECFVPLSNRCGSHNTLSYEAQYPRWHSFLSPIDLGAHNPPPSRPNVLAGTLLGVHPFGDLASLLAHCPGSREFSQQYELDYVEMFSLIAKITTVQVLLALAASKKLKVW